MFCPVAVLDYLQLCANELGCHKAPALMAEETPICSPISGPLGDGALFTEQSGSRGAHTFPTVILDLKT